MKCEYCDNPVPNGATRCPSCGAAVYSENGARTLPTSDKAASPTNGMATGETRRPDYSDCLLSQKNKWVYILLGLFLGEFGIHNFYAGYLGRGVVKLLVTILSFGLLFWLSWLWAIVEIATVRIDSRGVPFTS